jgi:hypothetical protein
VRALSPAQRNVLEHLARLQAERIFDHPACEQWGVPYRTSGSRCDHASLSRTLARLEARGLVIRQNWKSGNNSTPGFEGRVRYDGEGRRKGSRTTSVYVTPAGMEMANG